MKRKLQFVVRILMYSLSVIPNRITAFNQRERQRYDNSVLITYCWLFIFRKNRSLQLFIAALAPSEKKQS